MRGKMWKKSKLIPLFWEWVTAEKAAECTANLCHNLIAPGERVICVEEQHDADRPFKIRYWCTACSPEKCKRLIGADEPA